MESAHGPYLHTSIADRLIDRANLRYVDREMENVATYSEARSEYTKQLATMVVPPIVGWFQTVWIRNAADRQRCLAAFQSECEEVSRWNQDRIHDEVRVLLEKTGCDYMEELMTAVFIAHTKVLTAVRLSTKQKKLSITVPKLDHFVHRIFRESARSFWKAPFLFVSEGNVVDRQKNLLQIEGLATEAITTAVRSLLPVKQILHDYLGGDRGGEEGAGAARGGGGGGGAGLRLAVGRVAAHHALNTLPRLLRLRSSRREGEAASPFPRVTTFHYMPQVWALVPPALLLRRARNVRNAHEERERKKERKRGQARACVHPAAL